MLSNFELSDESSLYKFPVVVGIILVYLVTILSQVSYELSIKKIFWFTVAIIVHILMYIFLNVIFKKNYWLYFTVQGVIIFNCAVIMPGEYRLILIGLIPVLIFQSITVYYSGIKVFITAFYYYAIFFSVVAKYDGWENFLKYMPILVLITISVYIFSGIYLKQIKLRIRTQKISKKLELAYERVEELTLVNERQRMARDLHDTLSQGVAGIIMQLEAVNTNINNNNIEKSQEIVEKSMKRARDTLAAARYVIDDLRSNEREEQDLSKLVRNEISAFRTVSNASVTAEIRIESELPLVIFKNIVYIVRESLNNISKHAKAKDVTITIIEHNNKICIGIKDDGIGFDTRIIDKSAGHFGIQGITERVGAISGEINIESKRKLGTNINIIIPIP
ncbi:sensor histidine kinase [Clostridium oryzae]|uniref:histidine kinase n=1 Tax=Clostridium oryzae TaxID=1450648 RepID=A0A1V4IE01_9CLOT|nr:sensor histidine kinase [Clostridium oryzae]OPJ58181.1 sensor histidine kinase ComP [Clostridium oryzae]